MSVNNEIGNLKLYMFRYRKDSGIFSSQIINIQKMSRHSYNQSVKAFKFQLIFTIIVPKTRKNAK